MRNSPGARDVHIVDVGGTHELVTVELLHRERFLERMGLQARRSWVFNGGDAVQLLLSGQGDVAMQAGFGPALSAIVKGAPLRVIGGANLLTVHAIYSKDPGIRRLSDLTGRTVGVGAPGALTHQLAWAALRKHGVDPAGVKFVSIGNSSLIFQWLLAGRIDAGFGETEVFDHQHRYGVHALEDAVLWRELPEFPNQASFTTVAALRVRRDELVRTLAAHALLYRRLQGTDSWQVFDAASACALPRSDPRERRVQWEFYTRFHPFAGDLRLPEAQLRFLQELNVAMGLQDRVLPYDEIVDLSLARDALRMIGDAHPHGELA